VRRLKPETNVQ